MRCCVPRCKNTDNGPTSCRQNMPDRITFHRFPKEINLREAWLKALGKLDTGLLDSAVVCSQHFLNNQFYVTESGVRHIISGAIPSKLQISGKTENNSKTALEVDVKVEDCHDSLLVKEEIKEDNNHTKNAKFVIQTELETDQIILTDTNGMDYENGIFNCTDCPETVPHKHEYTRHLSTNLDEDTGGAETSQLHEPQPDSKVSRNSSLESEQHEDQKRDVDINPTAELEQTSENPDKDRKSKTYIDIEVPPINEDNSIEKTGNLLSSGNSKKTNINQTNTLVKLHDSEVLKYTSSYRSPNINEGNKNVLIKASESGTVKRNIPKLFHNEVDSVENVNVAFTETSESSSTNTEDNFTCNICGKLFKRKVFLDKHMKSHSEVKLFNDKIHKSATSEKQYACDLCQYKCSQYCRLKKHMRIHSGEKPYSCNLCDYKCNYSSNLDKHMRTHTGEKPFSCEFCEHRCSTSSNLETHMRIHTGEKRHSCKVCGHKCGTNATLKIHMRTHTGEKPYSCELCKFKFSGSGSLMRHMRMHTGEKPFSCTLCEYKCSTSSNLDSHMITHTGEKPFSCDFCEYKCARNRYLKLHMRKHTSKKPHSSDL